MFKGSFGFTYINGWIAVYLLTAVLAYMLVQSQALGSIVARLQEIVSSSFSRRSSRWKPYLYLVVLIGLVLTVAVQVETDQGNLLNSLAQLVQDESFWKRYSFILDDLLIAFAIIMLIAFLPILDSIFTRIQNTINDWRKTRFRAIKIQNLELITPDQIANYLLVAARYARYAFILLIASTCLTLLFSLYPVTEGLAQALLDKVVEVLSVLWEQILSFIPNLVMLTVIIVVTRWSLKLLHIFYEGLKRGKLRFAGIHAELVEPTYQLLRFLVVAFALVAAFPYIPGSSSPVFKGLSIFIGFLLSLGSTSLVSNIVSGIVLTYTRGLKIGDRVKIGDSLGDVTDRTLLVTRVRTIKNVIISIPNSIVLQNQIINYSTEADTNGLILHTSVTIGYDVPWRQVHHLLVSAARETSSILRDPAPFVLKTSLDDFYISYELNAYTDKPGQMATIYSELHQNILDQFNTAGVEIMSPSYMAVRDGQPSTIPEVEFSGNGNHAVTED